MSLKDLFTDYGMTYPAFLSSFCRFCGHKTLIEIGVQNGNTTLALCEVAKITQGKVFGYDVFEPIGVYTKTPTLQEIHDKIRPLYDDSLFKLTKINTRSDEFFEVLKKDTNGKIDFAFIDGDHSYDGIKNDFLKVYPLLSEEGAIALHDTYSHIGCRKFVLDLYKDLNDGTFDIINLPYGWNREYHRMGLTLLVKRSYPIHSSGANSSHDNPIINAEDVYKEEKEWYTNQLKDLKS